MRKLKDTRIKYKIKIEVIQKHLHEKGVHSNIPYLLYCKIEKGYGAVGISFDYTKKGKNRLLKFIREECFL